MSKIEISETVFSRIPMALLLEADPSVEHIRQYLAQGLCFSAKLAGTIVGACVLVALDNGTNLGTRDTFDPADRQIAKGSMDKTGATDGLGGFNGLEDLDSLDTFGGLDGMKRLDGVGGRDSIVKLNSIDSQDRFSRQNTPGASRNLDNQNFELINIAVFPEYQKKGIGSQLLQYVLASMKERGAKTIALGTGTFGYQLTFYQRYGFRVEAILKNHFIDTYEEPIFEQGIQLKDMLWLSLDL